MAIKIVISPGYGGGFSTWTSMSKEDRFAMITYPPLIEAIEKGEGVEEALTELKKCFPKISYLPFDKDDFAVVQVKGLFRINEYDGAESVEFFNSDDWWEV